MGKSEAAFDEAIWRNEASVSDPLPIGTGEIYHPPTIAREDAFGRVEATVPIETMDLGITLPELSPETKAKEERRAQDEKLLARLVTDEMAIMLDESLDANTRSAEVERIRNMRALLQKRMGE